MRNCPRNAPYVGGYVDMPRSSSLPLSKLCVYQCHIDITQQREEPVPLPRPPRERKATSRVYRHTVKRQLEASLTLPDIQKHGFTHPANGYFLMLPREYDVVAALESKAVDVVILAMLRRTVGVVGQGPRDRGEWVNLSIHALADATLLPFSQAQKGLKDALEKGYVQRRKAGRSWEYSVRWRGIQH